MMSTDHNDDIAFILRELSGLRRRISRLECALQAHNIPLPVDDAPADADAISARLSIDVRDPILNVTVSSGILLHLMPHQLEGTSFLLQNLLMNRGCILADAMGLGKSLQTLVALHSFMRQCRAPSSLPFKPAPLPDSARILMIAPLTVHPQWVNEVDRLRVWLLSGNTHTELPVLLTLDSKCGRGVLCKCRRSDASLDPIKNQSDPVIDLLESDESDSSDAETLVDQIPERAPSKGFGLLHELAIVEAWAHSSQGNCILMLNYHTALRLLDLSRAQRHRSRLEVRQLLLKQTNVLVLDEAHHIRNRKGNTHEALQCAFSNVHRRISLTGYPLQNSMNDFYSLLHFSRPLGIPELFIGDPNMFQEKFIETFKKALEPSLFPTLEEQIEHRLSLSMASEFRQFLKSTHVFLRRGPELLERTLKGRSEYVIRCRMPPLQHFIYSIFIACARQQRMQHSRSVDQQDQFSPSDLDGLSSFGITAQDLDALPSSAWMNQNFMHMILCAQWICDHPSVFRQYPARQFENSDSEAPAAHSVADSRQLDWINAVFELCRRKLGNSISPNMDDVQHSGKLFALIKLIEAATESHERVIVFTRWQLTLDNIASTLKIHLPNVIFRRLDGQTTDRAAILSEFKPQSTSSSQVLLVSTSCGAEGINLCGASRVVLFGVNWNPNDDLQAAQRIFRYGQTRHVQVYRMVTEHSVEERMLLRQFKKIKLSRLLTDTNGIQQSSSVSDIVNIGDKAADFFEPLPPFSTFRPIDQSPLFHQNSVVEVPLDSVTDQLSSLSTASSPFQFISEIELISHSEWQCKDELLVDSAPNSWNSNMTMSAAETVQSDQVPALHAKTNSASQITSPARRFPPRPLIRKRILPAAVESTSDLSMSVDQVQSAALLVAECREPKLVVTQSSAVVSSIPSHCEIPVSVSTMIPAVVQSAILNPIPVAQPQKAFVGQLSTLYLTPQASSRALAEARQRRTRDEALMRQNQAKRFSNVYNARFPPHHVNVSNRPQTFVNHHQINHVVPTAVGTSSMNRPAHVPPSMSHHKPSQVHQQLPQQRPPQQHFQQYRPQNHHHRPVPYAGSMPVHPNQEFHHLHAQRNAHADQHYYQASRNNWRK